MSPDRKKGGEPFVPPNPPPKDQSTASEVQNMLSMITEFHKALLALNTDQAERFRKMFAESGLVPYIKWAGWGGGAGVVLVLIELARIAVDIMKHYHMLQ